MKLKAKISNTTIELKINFSPCDFLYRELQIIQRYYESAQSQTMQRIQINIQIAHIYKKKDDTLPHSV